MGFEIARHRGPRGLPCALQSRPSAAQLSSPPATLPHRPRRRRPRPRSRGRRGQSTATTRPSGSPEAHGPSHASASVPVGKADPPAWHVMLGEAGGVAESVGSTAPPPQGDTKRRARCWQPTARTMARALPRPTSASEPKPESPLRPTALRIQGPDLSRVPALSQGRARPLEPRPGMMGRTGPRAARLPIPASVFLRKAPSSPPRLTTSGLLPAPGQASHRHLPRCGPQTSEGSYHPRRRAPARLLHASGIPTPPAPASQNAASPHGEDPEQPGSGVDPDPSRAPSASRTAGRAPSSRPHPGPSACALRGSTLAFP